MSNDRLREAAEAVVSYGKHHSRCDCEQCSAIADLEHVLCEMSQPAHYPPGMGEESRRLHREYNRLEAEQLAGAHNADEVVRLTDECAAKGIILVPGGENL